jgi:pimeloyl-ACP methyl ester carboxylesterase
MIRLLTRFEERSESMVTSKRAWFRAWSVWILVVPIWFAAGCAANAKRDQKGPMKGPLTGPAGRLHADDGGKGGLPVVFVHSFAGSSAHWSSQLAHLRRTRRAVALDLRGHGGSDAPPSGEYAVDSLANDIAAVANGSGLDRFVLVGHSMGGTAAIAYADAHPECVAGLVLVGTPGKSSPEMSSKIMTAMKADYEKVSEDYWKRLLTDARPEVETQVRSEMKRLPKDAGLAIIEAIFAYDPLPALRGYAGPKLIVDTSHGEGPGSLHSQMPDIPRKVVTGTSHWPHMDKPEEFNRILNEFLANVR